MRPPRRRGSRRAVLPPGKLPVCKAAVDFVLGFRFLFRAGGGEATEAASVSIAAPSGASAAADADGVPPAVPFSSSGGSSAADSSLAEVFAMIELRPRSMISQQLSLSLCETKKKAAGTPQYTKVL